MAVNCFNKCVTIANLINYKIILFFNIKKHIDISATILLM